MDLNSLQLSPRLIEELYENQLVHAGTNPVPEVISPAPPVQEEKWNYLGKNQKHVLIVVKNINQDFPQEDELKFLGTILKACKLDLNDVAILNRARYEVADQKEILAFFKSRIVLLFDVEPSAFGLPMNFPHYQIQPFAGNSFLYAPSLSILENNIEEKKKFWSSLKRLFNL